MRRKLLLFSLAAALSFGTLLPASNVLASELPEAAVTEITEETTEETTNTNTVDISQSTPAEISYKEETLTIKKDGSVADTFKGVDAVYRPGKNDGSNATYSCAAYIKKFYKEVYDVSVYNLYGGRAPLTYEGNKFKSVKAPKAGDIAYANSHWSIVKSVDKKNDKVVLIEQNWKWSQGGQTVCKVNRTLSIDSLNFYRLAE